MFKTRPYPVITSSTILFVREGEDDAAKVAAAAAAQAKLIEDAVAAATVGLKAKNDELLGKLKTSGDNLKKYDGIDPAKVHELMTRLDQDEDAKLLAEGKKNLVIEKYTERMRGAHADQLKSMQEQIAKEAQRADKYKGAVLDNQIRAVTGGLHKGAVEDALLHARQIFSLDADGNAVQLDSEGRPVLGKDGKSAFNPAEWIELQRELKPHWFPAASSGSGGEGKPGAAKGKTMKRTAWQNMAPLEQSTFIRSGGTLTD